MKTTQITALRKALEDENISYGELAEIDRLAKKLGIKVTDEMMASDTLDEIESAQPEEIASALQMANGGYAVAVLIRDYGENYFAYVYEPQRGEFTEAGALQRAQDTINAKTKGYLNDNWTSYTNGPSTLEWLEGEEFII